MKIFALKTGTVRKKGEKGEQTMKKALLNINETCEYLGIGKTKCRELLRSPESTFTVQIGNRFYAHKEKLDKWLEEETVKNSYY